MGLSSAAAAVGDFIRSWLATVSANRRLAAARRLATRRLRLIEVELAAERLARERAEADLTECKKQRDDLEGRCDVLRGQIEEMVAYQNLAREWADSIAARLATMRHRGDESAV